MTAPIAGSKTYTGTIVHIRHSLDWGFIQLDQTEEPVYFNGADLADRSTFRNLSEGQRVQFGITVGNPNRGLRACSIVVIDSSDAVA